jgi:hypothetical protein
MMLPSWLDLYISPEPNSGCWLWTSTLDKDGYPLASRSRKFKPRTVRAHRALYEIVCEPIGEGLTLDHTCRTKACVNPMHLEPVTRVVNVMRGGSLGAVNARKTHCKNGHSLDNCYVNPKGERICRPCRRDYMRIRRAENANRR